MNELSSNTPPAETLEDLAGLFIEWMTIKNYSKQSIRNRRMYLAYFINWCGERGLLFPPDITKPIIERYQRHLFYYRKKDGRPLSAKSQYARMLSIQLFFRWLARRNYILYNPASDIDMPKIGVSLPKDVLTAREADQILDQPDVTDPFGIRDRAILETLYSTGMRRMELASLTVYAVDLDGGTVMIREGKGRRDRLIPIGQQALQWIEKYIFDVRPDFVVPPDQGILFLNVYGNPLAPDTISRLVTGYIKAADIGKKGSCHLFRHTVATLMLQNGADIRIIQQLLGHASLETTQLYTHLSINHLIDVHTRTHPASHKPDRDTPK